MAEAKAFEEKWEAHFHKEVKGVTADKAWPLFEDFCSIHKLFPNHLSDCWAVEGDYGKPGLIRYCVATAAFLPPSAVHQPGVVYYAKEVLLTCDPIERCLSYQITENNLGINDYVATVKVDALTGGEGCCIHWSVVADPMPGRTFVGTFTCRISRPSRTFILNRCDVMRSFQTKQLPHFDDNLDCCNTIRG